MNFISLVQNTKFGLFGFDLGGLKYSQLLQQIAGVLLGHLYINVVRIELIACRLIHWHHHCKAHCNFDRRHPFYQHHWCRPPCEHHHQYLKRRSSSPSDPSASSLQGQGVPQVRCSPAWSGPAPSPPGCQGGTSPEDKIQEIYWVSEKIY